MKIKAKLTGSCWPMEFQGQVVEIDVTQVKLPDGLYWSTEYSGWEFIPMSGAVEGASGSLISTIGDRPSRIEITF